MTLSKFPTKLLLIGECISEFQRLIQHLTTLSFTKMQAECFESSKKSDYYLLSFGLLLDALAFPRDLR